MNLENAFELEIPNGEVKRITKDNQLLWQRAVEKTTEKGGNVSFNNTRYAGDGESYPAFPHTQVLPSVKAYGKTIEAKPQEELWGRYVPVEYIESNSSDLMIDTGIHGTTDSGLSVYIDIQGVSGLSGSNVIVCGNGGSQAGQWFGHNGSVYTSGTGASSNVSYNTRVQTTITFGTKVQYTLNEVTYTRNGNLPSDDEATTTLFHSGKKEGNTYGCKARLFKCKIENEGSLVRDFIPVKDTTTNEYGLFDRLNKVFYGNALKDSTGAFTGGNELKRIDYLESTGTQYINTEFIPNQDTRAVLDCYILAVESARYIGSSIDANNAFAIGNNGTNLSTRYYSALAFESSITVGKHLLDLNKNNLYVDKNLVNTFTYQTFTSNAPLSICQYGGQNIYFGKIKIYSSQIYNNGVQSRDFIPVKIGTTGYMLDTVEWKLYGNAGTGDFVCGPEIPNRLIMPYKLYGNKGEIKTTRLPNEYQEVEYIESTGTQWIDTGLYSMNYDTVDIMFSNLSKGAVQNVTGCRNIDGIALSNIRIGANNKIEPFYGSNVDTGITITDNKKYHVISFYSVGNQSVYVDDVLKGTGTISTARTNGSTDTIFGLHELNGTVAFRTYSKVYSCKYLKNNILLRDMIPCYRKSDNEIGLYDLVNNVFYTNQGTGTFLKGANIPPIIHADDAHNITLDGVTKSVNDLLYSANGYKDLQTGDLYQDWDIKVLNGTESTWGKSTATRTFYIKLNNKNALNGLCNLFEYSSDPTTEDGYFYVPPANLDQFNFAYRINNWDLEDWKAYLAEQYANGTPVIVIYPLATPTTTAGTADAYILTTKGNKTLSSDVAGTGVQATYLGE